MFISTVLLVATIALLALPALAGGPDGLGIVSWVGNTLNPTGIVKSVQCSIGNGTLPYSAGVTDDLYISVNNEKYLSFDLPYPTDEWHPVSWTIIANIAEASTLQFFAHTAGNPAVRYGVHGTNQSGEIVFHQPIYGNGDLVSITLDPGAYTFTAAASVSSVPEPGSMIAMLSGLVGFAGFGLRRRKS